MEIIIKLDHDEMDEVIQDLKLENDRLKQREEIMLHFIKSCACAYMCDECDIRNNAGLCHYIEYPDVSSTGIRMERTAKKLLSRLEDL